MPYAATIFAPEFLRLQDIELNPLLNVLRNPLATQIYLILLAQADFKTGWALVSYARLMELCRPPQPERGQWAKGPSLKQVRNAVDQLISVRIVKRNAEKNAAQGMLHLQVRPRTKPVRAMARPKD